METSHVGSFTGSRVREKLKREALSGRKSCFRYIDREVSFGLLRKPSKETKEIQSVDGRESKNSEQKK